MTMQSREQLLEEDRIEQAERQRLVGELQNFQAFLESADADVDTGVANAIAGQCWTFARQISTAAELSSGLGICKSNYESAGGKSYGVSTKESNVTKS